MENRVVMPLMVFDVLFFAAGLVGPAGSAAKRRWKNSCSALSQPCVSSRPEHRNGGFLGARPGHDIEQADGSALADSNS